MIEQPEALVPLDINITQSVGLVDFYNPKDHFIGEFDPKLLKQWMDKIMEYFQDEDVVYLAIHPSCDPLKTAKILSASSEHGDSIQVVICGTDCDDVKEIR